MTEWWQKAWRCDEMVVSLHALQRDTSKRPEIGFIGRSNAGKSSLVNALLDGKYAFTSKTPGRTKGLVFFDSDDLRIVDMPGYGFARISKDMRTTWENLVLGYVRERRILRELFVLIDIRRGVQKKDEDMLKILDSLGILCTTVLTKSDKLNETQGLQIEEDTKNLLRDRITFCGSVFRVSVRKKQGIDNLRKHIGMILPNEEQR